MLLRALCAVFALAMAAAGTCAAAPAYEKRWEGKLGGQSQYFVPQAIAAGDFAPDTGDEIAIFDTDGYAYFMSWSDNAVQSFWITSSKVTSGRVLDAVAADIDGNDEAETVFIDRDGKLNILGGDRRKFKHVCKNCLPETFADFKAGFVAPARADRDNRDELLLIGKWKNKSTALLIKSLEHGFKVLRAQPIDAKGDIMSLMPAQSPSRNRFYLHIYRGRGGDAVLPLYFDEEGINLEKPISLAPAKMSVVAIFPGDTDGDGKNELFILGSTGTGIKTKPAASIFSPGSGSFKPAPGIDADSAFLLMPDLNADGIPEIFTADYTGAARVSSKAVLTLKAGGKTRSVSSSDIILKKGAPFVSASLLPGVNAKRNGDYLALTRGRRRLILDLKKGKATLKTPEDEESQNISLEFVSQGGKVMVDARHAAEALGISVSWDALSLTLKLN